MTSYQIGLIKILLVVSVAFLVVPTLIVLLRSVRSKPSSETYKKSGISWIVLLSMCVAGAILCVRYAEGYYAIVTSMSDEMTLTWWEQIFSSIAHTLKTFSVDENYTKYMLNGKIMIGEMLGKDSFWQPAFGLYVSLLNFIAPIAGGAILFEILTSIFPKMKLALAQISFWREKYYFSELNDASMALAKSLYSISNSAKYKPVIIFTDVYVNDKDEKSSELLMEAKLIGAFCVRDDLAHVKKNKCGARKFFLIDKNESGNLHTLSNLANVYNSDYLKKSEIYLFTNDDAYVQVEKCVRDRLRTEFGFKNDELPVFVSIQSYRNLILNLLEDIPLYEPLIGKKRADDGTVDLTVTILGTGFIGTEMFLSTYWFGQILDCNLKINVLSQETEEEFWSKIDYVNPEIKRTTIDGDSILQINKKGDMAPVYCHVNYVKCDVKSSEFIELLDKKKEGTGILNTDYFLVSLGTDEANVSVANTVRRYVGEHHISKNEFKRAVIAYVVYDSGLADTLNRTKQFRYINEKVDVYMCAIGSIRDVYSVRNVFMGDIDSVAQKMHEAYLLVQNSKTRADKQRERLDDDYKYWSNRARAMHVKYKIFSMGLLDISLLDVESPDDGSYAKAIEEIHQKCKNIVSGQIEFQSDAELEKHMALLHNMAWLEHRRWNAFTRVKGFRQTDAYNVYATPGVKGAYKQMDIKLHPCLVECDKSGIRATINEKCEIDKTTLFMREDKSDFDLLDDLSYAMYEKNYNGFDFKEYDYPISDF